MKSKIEILEEELKKEREARIKAENELRLKTTELATKNKSFSSALNQENPGFKEFEDIIDSYILMDLEGNVLKMNSSAVDFFGYDITKEPFSVLDLIHEDEEEYAMKSFYTLIEKGVFRNYQAQIVTKSKEIKWVQINSNLIYDKDNVPIFAQGIVRDIDEQKKNELLFRSQKQQLDAIIENTSVGIVLTNLKGKIIKSNKAFQKILNYSEEELLNKTVQEISLEEDKEESLKYMQKLSAGEINRFTINKRYKTKNGEVIWVKTDVKNVRNKDIKTSMNVAVIQDITKELIQEKKVETLLSDLTKSNQELKDFAHVVSHDLKAPLRSMNTLTTWLQEDCNDFYTRNKKNFSLLHKNIDKMDLLIDGILSYASIDKVKYKAKKIDTDKLLREIIDITVIPSHIKINILAKLPIINGDIFRLQQLFQNLIDNAIKYIDKEKGLITINCISTQNYWQFSIEDNGKGIEEKYFKKIFQVFQMLENSEGSSGIGLSIVKKIVSFYNGKIWLNSELKKGTTFYFTLPK